MRAGPDQHYAWIDAVPVIHLRVGSRVEAARSVREFPDAQVRELAWFDAQHLLVHVAELDGSESLSLVSLDGTHRQLIHRDRIGTAFSIAKLADASILFSADVTVPFSPALYRYDGQLTRLAGPIAGVFAWTAEPELYWRWRPDGRLPRYDLLRRGTRVAGYRLDERPPSTALLLDAGALIEPSQNVLDSQRVGSVQRAMGLPSRFRIAGQAYDEWPSSSAWQPKERVTVEARDGLLLPALFSRAVPSARGGVILVHGGPWTQAREGFDPFSQWLVQLGFAVLEVDYRGSRGHDHGLFVAGLGAWGEQMQSDLYDAAHFATEQGWFEGGPIVVAGASYGGYATLLAATDADAPFSCGIAFAPLLDIASHIQRMLEQGNRRGFFEWQGAVAPLSQPGWLAAISPGRIEERLHFPVLLAHGSDDPIVPFAASEDYAARRPDMVEWLALDGEGHGLFYSESRRRFLSAVQSFLDRCEN